MFVWNYPGALWTTDFIASFWAAKREQQLRGLFQIASWHGCWLGASKKEGQRKGMYSNPNHPASLIFSRYRCRLLEAFLAATSSKPISWIKLTAHETSCWRPRDAKTQNSCYKHQVLSPTLSPWFEVEIASLLEALDSWSRNLWTNGA